MKDDTMLRFQMLRSAIRDKINEDEKEEFDYLMDSLTYQQYKYDSDMLDYMRTYDIILVDGTKISKLTLLGCGNFSRDKEVIHPQVMQDWDNKWVIPNKLVRYIRWR